ncbi:MAG: FkbM family methyltransferase [Parvularculaceae bacterium]
MAAAREIQTSAPAQRGPARGGLGPLRRAFEKVGMKLLDVGARGGGLPWLGFFAPFSSYYGCEPDATAAAGLRHVLKRNNPWRRTVVIPEALASKPGPATLYLTRHPGFSSTLKPNMSVVSDFGLEEEFTVEDTIEVPTLTLEKAAEKYGFEDVGFVKIDTQGTELDILKSGAALLKGPVQGVFVEVEFRQFYRRQPLFSEVEKFLRQCGFELIRMDPVARRRTTTDLRIGYSRREITWAHALFMKARPDPAKADKETLYPYLVRQIAIAVASEQFDLAADRIAHPDCAKVLKDAGLKVAVDDLDAYVSKRVARSLYEDFRKRWPEIVKDRPRIYT